MVQGQTAAKSHRTYSQYRKEQAMAVHAIDRLVAREILDSRGSSGGGRPLSRVWHLGSRRRALRRLDRHARGLGVARRGQVPPRRQERQDRRRQCEADRGRSARTRCHRPARARRRVLRLDDTPQPLPAPLRPISAVCSRSWLIAMPARRAIGILTTTISSRCSAICARNWTSPSREHRAPSPTPFSYLQAC